MSNYKAIVTRITNIEPHPNANRLRVTKIAGYNVIIGLNSEVGDRVILFPPDGQLSEIYAEKNDLVGYTDPETGERKGGYFDKNRRVKVTKLRGMKSEAYIASLDSLTFTGADLDSLKDGFEFDELNGFKICKKYYTLATKKMMAAGKKLRKENKHFRKHIDTSQYRIRKGDIQKGALIILTQKLHGSSQRGGYVLDTNKLPLGIMKRTWDATLGHIFGYAKRKEITNFEYLIGTRNVILDTPEKGFYKNAGANKQFRFAAFETFRSFLHKGEIVYSELVGFVNEHTPIMSFVSTDKTSDKELKKKYGKEMRYLYNCVPGQCDQYIYRITTTSDDGYPVEFPYFQMVTRAKELGVKTPPLMRDPFIFDGNFEVLDEIVENLTEGPDLIDDSHIREGVVIRAENPDGTTVFLKSKSFDFLVLEGVVRDNPDYVDLEEIS